MKPSGNTASSSLAQIEAKAPKPNPFHTCRISMQNYVVIHKITVEMNQLKFY